MHYLQPHFLDLHSNFLLPFSKRKATKSSAFSKKEEADGIKVQKANLCLYNDLNRSEINIDPVPSEADEKQGANIDGMIDITGAENKNIDNSHHQHQC